VLQTGKSLTAPSINKWNELGDYADDPHARIKDASLFKLNDRATTITAIRSRVDNEWPT
jgi:hypothetical protein